MTDSWNNMNIYTCWHGSSKLPIQLLMRHVQARHSSWLLSIEQLHGPQRQSTHTRPRFAPFCTSADSMLQLLQNNTKVAKADFTPALMQGPQRHAALTESFTGWVSRTHSSASPLLLHEARGVFPPTTDIPKGLAEAEAPETELESTVLSLQVHPCAKHALFWCQSSICKRVGSAAEGERLSTDAVDLVCPFATVCCRKRKYFVVVTSLNQHWQWD